MQDGVEGISSVAGVEIAPGVAAVAVQDEGLATVQQAGELGDDLCSRGQ